MKVLVCGGRDFKDWGAMRAILDNLRGVEEIIHGDARGADELAGRWALFRDVPCREFPAKWERHGRSAGYRRNVEMADTQPDIVIAFPGGKGTAHMVELAHKRGVRVMDLRGTSEPAGREDVEELSLF